MEAHNASATAATGRRKGASICTRLVLARQVALPPAAIGALLAQQKGAGGLGVRGVGHALARRRQRAATKPGAVGEAHAPVAVPGAVGALDAAAGRAAGRGLRGVLARKARRLLPGGISRTPEMCPSGGRPRQQGRGCNCGKKGASLHRAALWCLMPRRRCPPTSPAGQRQR